MRTVQPVAPLRVRGERWEIDYTTHTTHDGVGDQALHENNATRNPTNLRKIQKIGTWNVRGLLKPGKLDTVEKEITKCDLCTCGLTETHW